MQVVEGISQAAAEEADEGVAEAGIKIIILVGTRGAHRALRPFSRIAALSAEGVVHSAVSPPGGACR
jgi:hypothetical protein